MNRLADMIRAANRQRDREWADEFGTDWEASDQIDGMDVKHMKRELADLELAHQRVCLEQDIRTVKNELEWRIEKRKFEEEEAKKRADAQAVKNAANVTSLNGHRPLQ